MFESHEPFLILLCAVVFMGSPAGAQSENTTSVEVTLTNDSPAHMVDIRIGSVTVARLNAGASVTVQTEKKSEAQGRFELQSWASALDSIDPKWADFHLRTAGFYLDALDSGVPGDPSSARNVQALASAPESVWEEWLGRRSSGADVLTAYAARYNRAMTIRLMENIDPREEELQEATGPFANLGSVASLIRTAVDVHGQGILSELMASPSWAEFLGFGQPSLALAFTGQRKVVLGALNQRDDEIVRAALLKFKTADKNLTDQVLPRLSRAMEDGDESKAAAMAVDLALLWDRIGFPTTGATVRLVCGGLDGGARLALKSGRFLAAQAYLQLAASACGDERPYRARVAEYLSRMGDASFQRHDLINAVGWYRSALWFSEDKAHRARLADTLAEQALRYYEQGLVKEGGLAVEQARDIDPFRPRVLAISEAKPQIDQRARYALMVILVVLGFFTIRRLRRALGWSSPRTRPVRK